MLRVYDKGAESKGEIPGTRFELQERDAAADTAAAQLIEVGSIATLHPRCLVGFIDFRIGSGMVTRSPRAPWYAGVVSAVERLLLPTGQGPHARGGRRVVAASDRAHDGGARRAG